jgi:hypothetical protein
MLSSVGSVLDAWFLALASLGLVLPNLPSRHSFNFSFLAEIKDNKVRRESITRLVHRDHDPFLLEDRKLGTVAVEAQG